MTLSFALMKTKRNRNGSPSGICCQCCCRAGNGYPLTGFMRICATPHLCLLRIRRAEKKRFRNTWNNRTGHTNSFREPVCRHEKPNPEARSCCRLKNAPGTELPGIPGAKTFFPETSGFLRSRRRESPGDSPEGDSELRISSRPLPGRPCGDPGPAAGKPPHRDSPPLRTAATGQNSFREVRQSPERSF